MADHNHDYCHAEPQSGRGNRNYRVGTTYEIRGTSNVVGVIFFFSTDICCNRCLPYGKLFIFSLVFLFWPFHSHAWSMNDAYSTGTGSSTRCAHFKWANVYALKIAKQRMVKGNGTKKLRKQNAKRKKNVCEHLTNALTFSMGFTAFAHCTNVHTLSHHVQCTVLADSYGCDILRG